MASFTFLAHVMGSADLDRSHITDLAIIKTGGTPVLISTTRFDGVLRSWQIDGVPAVIGEVAYEGSDLPGIVSSLVPVTIGGATTVLTGGGLGGTLQTHVIGPEGMFGIATALPPGMTGFQHGVSVQLGNGTQAIYGALTGNSGIARLDLSGAGSFAGSVLASPGAVAEQISAIATVSMGAQDFLFTANSTSDTLTSWAIRDDGSLGPVQTIGVDDGLWIATPSALAVGTVGDTSYLVLGAAGSGTLSVMEIGSAGGLTLRDHLLDSLQTRIGGVTSIDIVAHNGQTYVIAGGADDGLSVFLLLEGGRLLDHAHIADTPAMGLNNVSAIAARGVGDGLDIHVASSSEPGLTQLRLDTGPAGTTATATLAGGALVGTAGNDILQGHDGADQINAGAGDDVIRDGAESDAMTGGAGADVFLLSADGVTDTITDFTVGQDRIDLSLWSMLHDLSQLTINIQPYGMDIRYGQELLVVQSADARMIDYRTLTNTDIIGQTRVPSDIVAGYPGPVTPPPILPPKDTPATPADQGGPFSIGTALGVLAAANTSDLRGALTQSDAPWGSGLGQTGSTAPDVLIGTAASDVLAGGAGDDIIMGRAGADHLIGGGGADLLLAGDGDDLLNGEDGHDILRGGPGMDTLRGGPGDDLIWGDAGADTFIFDGGTDIIGDFEQGVDKITLDAALWTGLTFAADVLAVYGSYVDHRATIDLGGGNILHIDGVIDYAALADSMALF